MKKSFLLFLFIGILFTSCENQLDNLPVEEIGQELKTKVVVKFNTTKALDVEEASNVFDVSIEELKAYMANQTIMSIPSSNPNARTISQETIEPIVSGTDTVMYLVNYPEGWCLFSGDKRTPAILAYSETGSMSQEEIIENPGRLLWYEETFSYINDLKSTIEYEESSFSLKEWAKFDSNINNVTSMDEGSFYTWTYIGDEPVSTETTDINPVLETLWGQYSPWNLYVPYKNSSLSERCPAGCVAVAASQMLYYLHYKIGYPQTMPSTGSCVGYADPKNYTQTFSNFSSAVFNEMAKNDSDMILYITEDIKKSAVMIGYIGSLLNTKYGNVSSSTLNNLITVFNNLGISCDLANLNINTITSSLKNRNPVIVSGYENSSTTSDGHAWILDGCRYDIVTYDEVYAFINDSLYWETGYVPENVAIQKIRKTYEPFIYVKMNWGTGIADNSTYYMLGDWLNYNYNKQMVTNFR